MLTRGFRPSAEENVCPLDSSTHDPCEQVTSLLPIPFFTPTVSPYMQRGYDMRLAAILAEMLGITPQALIKRAQESQAYQEAFEKSRDEMYEKQYGPQDAGV